MAEAKDYEEVMNAEKAKTMAETDKKCPRCGGTMDFDPASGGLHCPYCDFTKEIEAARDEEGNESAAELDFETAEQTGNCDWGVAQKTVTCKNCGAVSVYDALEVANVCPYCGSNQVMEANDINTLAPGGVVPFKISSDNAGALFTGWIKRKLFCPSKAKQSAKAESFQGVYLPYWTFDSDTTTSYSGDFGRDRKVKKGNEERIVTDWYPTSGVYRHFFDDELVCGSNRLDEGILNAILPFDGKDNKVYKPEYLAGFSAERYSVGLKDSWEKAKNLISAKIRGLISDKIISENRADRVRNLSLRTSYSNIKYKYLLMPVWISSFTYKGKIYQFMVNGQSGKVGGKSPISALRVLLAILIAIVIIVLLYYAMGE
ncbi:MAG: hypothetical protein K5931_08695 [Lachnospiraceae bacterium]|nr:hypothetical protein [Lachnospiraceae bacterium]